MKAKYLLYIVIFCSALTTKAQSNWQTVRNTKTGIEFKMPPNIIMSDTLLITLYAAEIDTVSAVQVNVLDSAQFDSTDALYNEALALESGDTLRAIARIMLFATEGTATSVNTIYTNGIKGLELGMQYETLLNPNYF